MVFKEMFALGRVLLKENMRREMSDISSLYYADIPSANVRLRRNNGHVADYDVFSPDTSHPISYWGDELAVHIQQVAEETGRYVMIVGYSIGGVIARHAVQEAGADRYVNTLGLLAVPNHGTRPDEFEPLEEFRPRVKDRYVLDDIFPDSAYLKGLNDAPPPKTAVYNIYTSDSSDWMVSPESACLDWAENTELRDVRHSKYLSDRKVGEILSEIYPPNTPIIYVHGLHNLLSIMLEGTVLYPWRTSELPHWMWLPAQEKYIAENGFRPIHSSLSETGKMKAELKAVA